MKLDKEKKEKIMKYLSRPSTRKYIENIKSSSKEERNYLYKIQKEQRENYSKQQAEIKAGVRPSKAKYKLNKAIERISSKVGKYLSEPQVNKKVLRSAQRVTIDLRQPVYQRDKSRFFKEQWEEEKKQLFFS